MEFSEVAERLLSADVRPKTVQSVSRTENTLCQHLQPNENPDNGTSAPLVGGAAR